MKSFDRNDPKLWEILPDWVHWIAYNMNLRSWFCFRKNNIRSIEEPFILGKNWKQAVGRKITQGERLKFITINMPENWQDSLTERPK